MIFRPIVSAATVFSCYPFAIFQCIILILPGKPSLQSGLCIFSISNLSAIVSAFIGPREFISPFIQAFSLRRLLRNLSLRMLVLQSLVVRCKGRLTFLTCPRIHPGPWVCSAITNLSDLACTSHCILYITGHCRGYRPPNMMLDGHCYDRRRSCCQNYKLITLTMLVTGNTTRRLSSMR